jgi:anthranilate synthase component 1
MNNKENKIYLIANALIMDDKKEKVYNECLKTIESYEKVLKKKSLKVKKYKAKEHIVSTDTEKTEFGAIIQNIKKSILEGDIYQAFPSRTIISNYNAEPFDIYKQLRSLKRPYMFYINSDEGILFGVSSEMSLKVEGGKEKTIEVKPLAGIKPRFIGKVDIDIENRYEAESKIDFKEIAKHIMTIDLIRSDIARVAKLGSRHLDSIFVTEKYSNEQYLVSSIRGILKEDLDALHAYISCMNRLSGCPKIEAIKLLRQFEKNKRGYFSGSICYLNPDKDFYGCIIKNAIRLKSKKAYIRVNADIVYDSTAEKEFKETEKKSKIYLEAIKEAGGLK